MSYRIYEDQFPLFGQPKLKGYSDGEIAVQLIHKEKADAVIREGHYSGSVCWASYLHLGVFAEGGLLGAMQYGPLMNPASAEKIVAGSSPEACAELNRMWMVDDKPPNTTTRAIAFSLKLLRSHKPKVEWVQSFADERCLGLGVVYQAASFLYCGEHTTTFYELDGEWFHKSAIGRKDSRGWGVGPKITRFNENAERAVPHTFRQFRYVKPLTKSARRGLLLPTLPYPKRAEGTLAA